MYRIRMVIMKKFIIFFVCLISNVYACEWFAHDKAASLMQQGKWAEAKEVLQKVVIDKPDSPEVLYDAGIASYRTKDFNQALAYFNQVTNLKRATEVQKEQAYFNAGNTAVELKKLKEAIEFFEAALRINPNNEQAKYNLEKVKEMLKQQQEQQKQKEEKENKEQKENNKEEQENKSQEKQQDKNQKEQQKKDQQDKSETQNQPGGEQEKGGENSDKNEKGEKKPQENQEQAKKDKEQEKEQQQAQSKEEQEKNQGEKEDESQGESEQEQEESDEEQRKKEEEKEQGRGSLAQDDKKQKDEKAQKVEAWLAHLLKEQEEKDAALNKQMIKATVNKTLVGKDGQNCW
jgi:hypothetical protein